MGEIMFHNQRNRYIYTYIFCKKKQKKKHSYSDLCLLKYVKKKKKVTTLHFIYFKWIKMYFLQTGKT